MYYVYLKEYKGWIKELRIIKYIWKHNQNIIYPKINYKRKKSLIKDKGVNYVKKGKNYKK